MYSETEAAKVVILGAGATIGSGYKRCIRTLPGDRGFFGHNEVQELLRSGGFPVLESILRSLRRGQAMDTPPALGLEEVWTFLDFVQRDIFRNSIDLSAETEHVWNQIRRPESSSADDHCQIKAARTDQTLPATHTLDLLMLAGWDIRRILTRIYGDIAPPMGSDPYEELFERLKLTKAKPATFISLKYDTVLEQALTRAKIPWHYGYIDTNVTRSPEGIRILKPHGSLNWRFKGNVPPVDISTDYSLEPVQCESFENNDFVQPMIVEPTQTKQVITYAATQADATNQLLKEIWGGAVTALKDASEVIVVGYSFPSTDHHFKTLCHLALRRRNFQPYSDVWCGTVANGGEGEVFAGVQRNLPAVNFHLVTNGLEGLARDYKAAARIAAICCS